jgi:hypothetical protein
MHEGTFVTLTDLTRLSMIVSMAGRCAKVARQVDGVGIVYGQARSVGDERGNFTPSGGNVIGEYLRVTTREGMEAFWPVEDLADEIASGHFAEYDW